MQAWQRRGQGTRRSSHGCRGAPCPEREEDTHRNRVDERESDIHQQDPCDRPRPRHRRSPNTSCMSGGTMNMPGTTISAGSERTTRMLKPVSRARSSGRVSRTRVSAGSRSAFRTLSTRARRKTSFRAALYTPASVVRPHRRKQRSAEGSSPAVRRTSRCPRGGYRAVWTVQSRTSNEKCGSSNSVRPRSRAPARSRATPAPVRHRSHRRISPVRTSNQTAAP